MLGICNNIDLVSLYLSVLFFICFFLFMEVGIVEVNGSLGYVSIYKVSLYSLIRFVKVRK